LKAAEFLSILRFFYSLYLSWIYFIISSSSNSSYLISASLNLLYPTPKPGFLITKSGSSSSYLIILFEISLIFKL